MAVQPLYVKTYNTVLADVSTASQVYIRMTSDGVLEGVHSVLNGALAAANAVLTVKQSGSATATLGTITITQSGSAAGDVDSLALTTNVVAGDLIEIETDGGSTNTVPLNLQAVVRELTR